MRTVRARFTIILIYAIFVAVYALGYTNRVRNDWEASSHDTRLREIVPRPDYNLDHVDSGIGDRSTSHYHLGNAPSTHTRINQPIYQPSILDPVQNSPLHRQAPYLRPRPIQSQTNARRYRTPSWSRSSLSRDFRTHPFRNVFSGGYVHGIPSNSREAVAYHTPSSEVILPDSYRHMEDRVPHHPIGPFASAGQGPTLIHRPFGQSSSSYNTLQNPQIYPLEPPPPRDTRSIESDERHHRMASWLTNSGVREHYHVPSRGTPHLDHLGRPIENRVVYDQSVRREEHLINEPLYHSSMHYTLQNSPARPLANPPTRNSRPIEHDERRDWHASSSESSTNQAHLDLLSSLFRRITAENQGPNRFNHLDHRWNNLRNRASRNRSNRFRIRSTLNPVQNFQSQLRTRSPSPTHFWSEEDSSSSDEDEVASDLLTSQLPTFIFTPKAGQDNADPKISEEFSEWSQVIPEIMNQHIDLDESDTRCTICCENFKEPHQNNEGKWEKDWISPFGPCMHYFHTHCILPWLKKKNPTCPNCRGPT